MFRSASFKLTLWYVAIVMAISLVFSTTLYHVATAELARGLHHETQRIFNQYPVFVGDPGLRAGGDLSNGSHRILLQLIILNVIVLIASTFVSYLLARRTLQPIEDAHEQQRRFTANVSHELRTPLTALKMESEVALMNPKGTASEFRTTLQSNLEEVAKLEALINNLLRLSHLEDGELQQSFKVVPADAIVDEALKAVAAHAENKALTITSTATSLPLYGDPQSLTQLLVIILDNAIKYSPQGKHVELTTATSGDNTVVTIADHGVGIPKDALEHVFDRFYRGDSSRNKLTTEGFGLGLSIAHMIVDLHNGSIVISSRPDHGTTVVVTVPAQP